MNEYSDECILTFLKNQGQLFSEPVAENHGRGRSFFGRLHGCSSGFSERSAGVFLKKTAWT